MSLPIEENSHDTFAVFRLLSGPLCGCEYQLEKGSTLVIAGTESTLLGDSGMPQLPDNAIVIPVSGGVNFEILIDDAMRDGFRLRVLESQVAERTHVWQERCIVGALTFAIRRKLDDWSPDMTNVGKAREKSPGRPKYLMRRFLIGALGVFCLLGVGLTCWMIFKDGKRVSEVAAIVAGSSDQYRIAKGRDGLVYIFAESERGVSWAKQALAREGFGGSALVSTFQAEESRLATLLQENYPTIFYHRIKFDNPSRPKLMLSQERARLAEPLRKALTASMLQWMPYAESAEMTSWSDNLLDRQARDGLDRLGVRYTRNANGTSVTYDVQTSVNDAERSSLQDFVSGFYRDFGARYVYFSIALKDDVFKGKSFGYGINSYVKLAPKHWFFPQSLTSKSEVTNE